jgi:hypothetical protein
MTTEVPAAFKVPGEIVCVVPGFVPKRRHVGRRRDAADGDDDENRGRAATFPDFPPRPTR